jgi:hypothetical protein
MKLERIKSIYAELEKYVVQLHPDPRLLGPHYLNDLIATTRNYLNAVSRIQLEVHQEKQYLARDTRAHEAALQISADDLLANDERVRRLPSIEDRKATVAVFLRAEKQVIENLKATMQDVEYVEKAVRHRHKELTSTMSEIKLQRSLIRDEIDTGAMYGDERTYGAGKRGGSNPVAVDEFSEDELEKLLAGGDQAAPPVLPPLLETASSSEFLPPEPTVEEAISTFLGDGGTESAPPDDDFDTIFENL